MLHRAFCWLRTQKGKISLHLEAPPAQSCAQIKWVLVGASANGAVQRQAPQGTHVQSHGTAGLQSSCSLRVTRAAQHLPRKGWPNCTVCLLLYRCSSATATLPPEAWMGISTSASLHPAQETSLQEQQHRLHQDSQSEYIPRASSRPRQPTLKSVQLNLHREMTDYQTVLLFPL